MSRVIDVDALLRPVFDELPSLRVGWPDDVVKVKLRDVDELRGVCLVLVETLQTVWPNTPLLADVDVYMEQRRLDVRIVAQTASNRTALLPLRWARRCLA